MSQRLLPCLLLLALLSPVVTAQQPQLRAGAAVVNITPTTLPVIINGSFEEHTANKIHDPIFAKALVLTDGTTKLAIVVVDSCMLPRELLDEAKEGVSNTTGIPAERMLISATHTHSAPAAMGCLGSDADANYVKFLPGKLVEVIEKANSNLAPAKLGYAAIDAPEYVANRRWIRRPDRMLKDPFGELTVRANMHPGFNSPDAIGPSGPVDPQLSVLSVQSADGKPLALLANYSMHYFSAPAVSADYFGHFCRSVAGMLNTKDASEGGEFVAMMSQGTSGDAWLADYSKPKREVTTKLDEYGRLIARKAFDAYEKIEHRSDVTLAMAERKLTLNRRTPSPERLAWAQQVVKEFEGKKPKGHAQVYAREQLFLHAEPTRELKLQALRIGDLAITAIPNEVFSITGLKLKTQSRLPATFNITLANGSEGYIPPPEQHYLGGYTTWPARTAALEVEAEPKIVEALTSLLESVAGKARRVPTDPPTPYSRAVIASKPIHYFRLTDLAGPSLHDSIGTPRHRTPARFEPGVALHVDGPALPGLSTPDHKNSAVHLAGGRITSEHTSNWRTLELWFWSGLPDEARTEPALLFSYGRDAHPNATDSAGIDPKGRVFFERPAFDAPNKLTGKTVIQPRTWYHLAVVFDNESRIYLNGQLEAAGPLPPGWSAITETLALGGGLGATHRFEGKLDEVATYDRPLSPEEIAAHYAAATQHPSAFAPSPGTPGEGRGEGLSKTTSKAPAPLERDSHPLSPAEALTKFHLKEGYEIELVAAEPLVVDPVAID